MSEGVRSSQEILADACGHNNGHTNEEMRALHNQYLMLEVLLDIRTMLEAMTIPVDGQ